MLVLGVGNHPACNIRQVAVGCLPITFYQAGIGIPTPLGAVLLRMRSLADHVEEVAIAVVRCLGVAAAKAVVLERCEARYHRLCALVGNGNGVGSPLGIAIGGNECGVGACRGYREVSSGGAADSRTVLVPLVSRCVSAWGVDSQHGRLFAFHGGIARDGGGERGAAARLLDSKGVGRRLFAVGRVALGVCRNLGHAHGNRRNLNLSRLAVHCRHFRVGRGVGHRQRGFVGQGGQTGEDVVGIVRRIGWSAERQARRRAERLYLHAATRDVASG